MPNYKPYAPSIVIGGHGKPSAGNLKILYEPVNGSAAADTFRDTENDAPYQIPSDRTLEIFAVTIDCTAADAVVFYQGTTQDATTLGILVLYTPAAGHYEYAIKFSAASSTWIVVDPIGTTITNCMVYGLEIP